MKYSEKQLICIECCDKIESLFKTYQDGFRDISECVSCCFYFLIQHFISFKMCVCSFISK